MNTNPSNSKSAARKAAPKAKPAAKMPAASQAKAAAKRAAKSNVVELPVTKAPSQRSRKAAVVEPIPAAAKADVETLAAELPIVEPAPKAKRASTKRTPATGEPEVESHPLMPSITPEQVDDLNRLQGQMVNATAAFEAAVVGLLNAGASPTHIGKALGLGNSSIRRIGWRHGWQA